MPYLSVLFESLDSITLILSCFEISFKTAVNSICLRTCILLFSLVSQSGCKTKTSFCFSQEKLEKILKLSYRFSFSTFPSNLSMSFRVLRGANVKSFFFSRKLFPIFFFRKSLFQNMIKLPECLRAFFAVAGAKVEPFSAFPTLFPDFFQSFFKLFLNCLITDALHFGCFWISVGFFLIFLEFSYFIRLSGIRF